MANSRYQYVKSFERENYLLPDTYIVIRVDGKGFHKFSEHYGFEKPNDERALQVMNRTALHVVKTYPDIMLAYGDSDEYSFLLRRQSALFERREMKLNTTFASLFSTTYMYMWNLEFPDKPIQLTRMPNFDARSVVYPNIQVVRDYFAWRQVDCHINNLYNTTFWALVKGGMSPKEAENRLIGTVAADKNEILFKEFGINYNNEPEMFKKGTIIVREYNNDKSDEGLSDRQKERAGKARKKANIEVLHVDLIKDAFWEQRDYLTR